MSKSSLEYQMYLKDPNIIDPSFINEKLGLNLQDILKEHILELLVVTDFNRMDAQYKIYLETFPDLTYKSYRLLVLKIVYEEVPMLFERFKDEIDEWIHKTKDTKRKILLHLKEFQLHILSTTQLKEFVPIKNGIIEHSFYNLNLKITLSKKITNVLTVFKEFPVSDTIPLIFTKIDKKITTKVYTEPFLDKSIIKKWIDKAKTKIDKSIVFRLKVSDSNYAKVVLYDNVLLVKYIFTSKDKVNFYNAKEFVKNNVKPLVKHINYILNENVNIQDIDIKYTTIKINMKSFRDVFHLKNAIKTKFTKQFTVLPMKYKMLLTVKYNGNTIQINNTDNQFVKYFSIRNYSDFKDTINALTHVFIAAKTAKPKEHKKNVKNIELLKREGIKIDSKGCQKRRQPVITTKTDNAFFYKNNYIVCNDSVYPHPGFTDNNVLCCFKKNQTKKEAYIRNTSNTSTPRNDNIILLNKPILKTIGSTPPNRIAILNVLIEKALNKVLQNEVPFVFYRLGNYGDEFAHLFDKKMPEYFLKNEEVLRYIDNGSYFGKTLKIQDVQYVIKLEIMSIFYKTNFLFIDVNRIIKIITNESYPVVILYKSIKKIENIICIDNQEVTKFFSLPETKTEYIIKKQYVNPLNKVTFLETNYGIMPIKPRVIYIGIPFTENIKELQHQEASQQYNNLQHLEFKVQEQIISDNKTIGLLVNNVIVPTNKSEQIPALKTQEYQGIQDPDLILKSRSTLFNKETITDLIYQRLRYLLSFLFKTRKIQDLQHLEDYIFITKDMPFASINIPKDTNLFVCDITSKDPFCKNGKLVIPKDLYTMFIQKISQDIKLKNKEGMQIVKGTVKKYILGPNNYIKKRNEKIIKK